MKELKDYLHLYLGCGVEYNVMATEDDVPTGDKARRTGDMDSFLLDEFLTDWDFYEPKLILRPLSDLTEGELNEWQSRRSLTTDGVHVVQIRVDTPASFHYLISLGFDLFNLIIDGLAIDKTKIK